ncbi:MAG: copper homeostasis protein CutC [Chloroflexi bacterium]|nr:copper homeostasis protein CutC [Chloroflexota bacterium]
MLEVIALSLDDALRAEVGGATRLEVTCAIEQDGLTPPLDLVERILAHVRIPIRVMLRPRDSFAIADADELDEICAQACVLAALPIDGLVLGWLRASAVDVSALRAIAAVAPHLQFTFHRAVERAADIDAALDALRTIPQVDTILHSGGATLPDVARIAMLRDLHTRCAAHDFTLLAGGGLNAALIARLRRETFVCAFHLGRAVRRGGKWEGVVEMEGIVNGE